MSIDVNIEHYTKEELERLFRLETGYTLAKVLDGERELYKKLVRTVPDRLMQETIASFLKQVTQRLTIKEPIVEKIDIPQVIEKEKTTPYVFTVDSMYRATAFKAHDFIYNLPEPIRIRSIQIECLDMPVLWNEFNQSHFFLNDLSIHIPDGTYTPSEMEKLLYSIASMDVSIQSRTMIRSAEPFEIDFGKRFKSAGWILGFRRETYKSVYNVITSKHEIESEAMFGHLTECVYVDVYDFHDTFTPEKVYEGRSNYIMGYFPVTNLTRVQHYTMATRVYSEPIKLERLRIQLLNKFGDPFLIQSDFSIHFVVAKM